MKRTRQQVGKFSKNKGYNFEREVSLMLNDWAAEKLFKPQTKDIPELHHRGDIAKPEWFPFPMWCRKREGWNLEQMLKSPLKCNVLSWWEEIEHPDDWLVFARNYFGPYVMCQQGLAWKALDERVNLKGALNGCAQFRFQFMAEKVMLFKLEDFLEMVDVEGVRIV